MQSSLEGPYGTGGGTTVERETSRLTHDQRVRLKEAMARAERVLRIHKNVW